MENWGLVTFRESAVLFDSTTGSVADKKLVTMIVDHELAHQVKVQPNANFRSLVVALEFRGIPIICYKQVS